MVYTLATFAKRANDLADQVEEGGTKSQRAAASAIIESVVHDTPVGDPKLWKRKPGPKFLATYRPGKARANWRVSLGSIDRTVFEEKRDKEGGATISQARFRINTSRKGDTIYITNPVPYIHRLNNGWSTQAPVGFIEKAVMRAVATIKNFKFLK